ncbi:MAG TPA: class I SAM-dependent methyltransferase, partial [Thermoanaerobaculia bacterium]|nr:class I SAM-dependent methyltransferase [Thermoanaerobaculia bacterium]
MSRNDVAHKLAALYDRRSLRQYVLWKVRTDPAYRAVFEQLRGRDTPILDLGCGVGLLAFYLRESGFTAPIIGVDFDERKIDLARIAARRYRDVEFIQGDARAPLPDGHDVVILDILQYFDDASQREILEHAARAVAQGGKVILRQALRDDSWRYRLTAAVDGLARKMHWMKAEHLR